MRCQECQGSKLVLAHINRGDKPHSWQYIACFTCGGTGEITEEHAARIERGQMLYRQRLNAGESLFEAAKRQGMTCAQLSAIEHGREVK